MNPLVGYFTKFPDAKLKTGECFHRSFIKNLTTNNTLQYPGTYTFNKLGLLLQRRHFALQKVDLFLYFSFLVLTEIYPKYLDIWILDGYLYI